MTWLPERFESSAVTLAMRKRARAATVKLAVDFDGPKIRLGTCTRKNRCRSGLCPICVRRLRIKLMRFLDRGGLSARQWWHVTIKVADWTIAPGDVSPFGALRDRSEIKAFAGRLRRVSLGTLVLLGSVEVVFKTVANRPVGKVFHAHFVVSGVTKSQISDAARNSFKPDLDAPRPFDIQPVGHEQSDFVRVASYSFAQPYWKTAYVDEGSRRGISQFPKTNELAELIGNLGPHPWNGRLIMIGMRFDRGTFRLT